MQNALVNNNTEIDQLVNLLCNYYMLLVIINKSPTITLTDKTITMLRQKLAIVVYRPKTPILVLRLLTFGLGLLASVDMQPFFMNMITGNILFQIQEYFEKLKVIFDTELLESHFSEEMRPSDLVKMLSDE